MDNLYFYNLGREVPDEAKKPINAGRLKGMTDINPMWRIKRLTEMFGPCGVGWWYDITDKQIIYDDITKQSVATVDILLYYINPFIGKQSHGIPGTGGASFVAQERNGPYMSDECFKMALTDAISVAAKSLGIGADVYFAKDSTKYAPKQQVEDSLVCSVCGKAIKGVKSGDKMYTPEEFSDLTKGMCYSCYRESVKADG